MIIIKTKIQEITVSTKNSKSLLKISASGCTWQSKTIKILNESDNFNIANPQKFSV